MDRQRQTTGWASLDRDLKALSELTADAGRLEELQRISRDPTSSAESLLESATPSVVRLVYFLKSAERVAAFKEDVPSSVAEAVDQAQQNIAMHLAELSDHPSLEAAFRLAQGDDDSSEQLFGPAIGRMQSGCVLHPTSTGADPHAVVLIKDLDDDLLVRFVADWGDLLFLASSAIAIVADQMNRLAHLEGIVAQAVGEDSARIEKYFSDVLAATHDVSQRARRYNLDLGSESSGSG